MRSSTQSQCSISIAECPPYAAVNSQRPSFTGRRQARVWNGFTATSRLRHHRLFFFPAVASRSVSPQALLSCSMLSSFVVPKR